MSFSALPLFFAALLALACFSSASATYAPTAHGFSSDAVAAESAINANDLSGVWSALDASGATNTVKFVQQGNQLLLPLVNRPVPYGLNATLYGGYGTGQGALFRINNPGIFCSYTDAVVDVVDAGFMKITWFPKPAANDCTPFAGAWTKYTRPY